MLSIRYLSLFVATSLEWNISDTYFLELKKTFKLGLATLHLSHEIFGGSNGSRPVHLCTKWCQLVQHSATDQWRRQIERYKKLFALPKSQWNAEFTANHDHSAHNHDHLDFGMWINYPLVFISATRSTGHWCETPKAPLQPKHCFLVTLITHAVIYCTILNEIKNIERLFI